MGIFGKGFESKSESKVGGGGKRVTRNYDDGSSEDRTYVNGKLVDITDHKGGKSHSHEVGHGVTGPFKGSRKDSDSGSGSDSGSKSGCFLSTACFASEGLPDNCIELQTLRKFRDDFVSKSPNGVALIKQYYSEAPLILKRIEAESGGGKKILKAIYTHIRKIVDDINENNNHAAMNKYMRLFNRLKKTYMK